MRLRHAPPLVTIVLLAALPVCAQESSTCPTRPGTLAAMRNCYRPLLVFAPSAVNANFKKQQMLLEQYADDMMDRNILYVPAPSNRDAFKTPLDAPYAVLTAAQTAAMRRRFQVDAGSFAVILLGEDGEAKFHSATPVSVLTLDSIVDAMPMRKRQLQK